MSKDAYTPHPDRLLPTDPAVREVARDLYERMRDQPIISPHGHVDPRLLLDDEPDRKSTRLNSSHVAISYAVFCLKKKTKTKTAPDDRTPAHDKQTQQIRTHEQQD